MFPFFSGAVRLDPQPVHAARPPKSGCDEHEDICCILSSLGNVLLQIQSTQVS